MAYTRYSRKKRKSEHQHCKNDDTAIYLTLHLHLYITLHYLGSLITSDKDCTKYIKRRIEKAKGVLAGFNTIWKSKTILYQTKLQILKTCILQNFSFIFLRNLDDESI